MSIPTPRQDPNAWQVTIGTILVKESVIRAHLFGLETSSSYDKPKARGRNGASIRFTGDELATFSIRLTGSNADGLNTIRAICRYVREASREQGIAVSHPMLQDADVASMVVEKIKWPDNASADTYVAELSCTQWAAPPKTTKSVAKKITDADLPGDLLSSSKKPPPPPPPKPWETK